MQMQAQRRVATTGRGAAAPSIPIKCARRSIRAAASLLSPPATEPWHKLELKHVLEAQQFNKESLDVIFEEALKMEKVRAASSRLGGGTHQPPG